MALNKKLVVKIDSVRLAKQPVVARNRRVLSEEFHSEIVTALYMKKTGSLSIHSLTNERRTPHNYQRECRL